MQAIAAAALRRMRPAAAAIIVLSLLGAPVGAQQDQSGATRPSPPAARPNPAAPAAGVVRAPGDYVIGPGDVLDIQFWREKDLSGEVTVRPDGKITTPLLNDVQAADLTPDELRVRLVEAAAAFLEDTPVATVVVKQINSRRAFITGEVDKPGPYSVAAPTTVLQLIAMAGGLKEYAKRNRIVVLRTEKGRQVRLMFDYDKVVSGKALAQNIELRPGDTVVVP